MKKSLFMISSAVLGIMFCAGCDKPEAVQTAPQQNVSVAIDFVPAGADTKAVKNGWEDGDIVYLFIQQNGAEKPLPVNLYYRRGNWVCDDEQSQSILNDIDGDGSLWAVYADGFNRTFSKDADHYNFGQNTDWSFEGNENDDPVSDQPWLFCGETQISEKTAYEFSDLTVNASVKLCQSLNQLTVRNISFTSGWELMSPWMIECEFNTFDILSDIWFGLEEHLDESGDVSDYGPEWVFAKQSWGDKAIGYYNADGVSFYVDHLMDNAPFTICLHNTTTDKYYMKEFNATLDQSRYSAYTLSGPEFNADGSFKDAHGWEEFTPDWNEDEMGSEEVE